MEKKKSGFGSTYLLILGVITVICIIAGIKIHAVSADVGKEKSGNIEIGACTDLDLNLKSSSVEIVKGTNWNVEYKNVPEKLIPKVTNKDGKMSITQKRIKGYNFNFGFLKLKSHSGGKIIITIPDDVEAIDLDAKLDMGSLKINDIVCGDVTVDIDMGKTVINNIEADKLNVDADMGAIKIEDVTANDIELDADMGSIDVVNTVSEKIVADADMGSIDVEAAFKKIEAKADMGSVDVNFKDELCSEDEVKVSLKADMGSVKYNGEKHGKKFEK